jgi:hypothetical protein
VLQVREGRAAGKARRLKPDVLLRLQDLHEGQAPEGKEGEGDMMKKWGLDAMETGKSYLVLGRGDVGFAIASRLKCRCAEVATSQISSWAGLRS